MCPSRSHPRGVRAQSWASSQSSNHRLSGSLAMAWFHVPVVLTLIITVLPPSPTVEGRSSDSEINSRSLETRTFSKYNEILNLRNKRAGSSAQLPRRAYQTCMAVGNRPGHCKHLSSCEDDNIRYNFPRLMDYLCVIESQFIGVCCPDDTSRDKQNNELPVGGLAGWLPAVATDSEDSGGETSDGGDRSSRASRGCGISTRDQSRISGGRPTSSREWPWIAALLSDLGIHFCGGTLITDRHVLTAGHCVYWKKPRDILIRLGEYDLRYKNETRALDFRVTEIRLHAGYVRSTYKNDIALLKIHRPTIFNTYIWPVCLPPVGNIFTHKQATVIGWGTTTYGGIPSNILMEVNVPIWSQESCAQRFTQEITSNHICAGAYDGNGDACQGDSGGPLLVQLKNGRWVNVGIVSWGIGCGEVGRPGIYTRVNTYLDWIIANAVF